MSVKMNGFVGPQRAHVLGIYKDSAEELVKGYSEEDRVQRYWEWPRRKTVAIDKRNKGTLETCRRLLPVDRVSSLVRSLVQAECHKIFFKKETWRRKSKPSLKGSEQ